MSDLPDYYAILGVPTYADQRLIETTYRRLARKYHPDINPSPEAHERMAAINEAYAVLRDPDKRARYDAQRRFVERLRVVAPWDGTNRGGLASRRVTDALHMALFWQRQKQRWHNDFFRRTQRILRAYGYRPVKRLPTEQQEMHDQLWTRRGQLWYVRVHAYPVLTVAHIKDFRAAWYKVPRARASYMTAGEILPAAREAARAAGIVLYDRARLAEVWERARKHGRL